jgi:hypothetical protein
MSFKELQTEKELLSREDEKVRQLLGSLKKIDAPKNFDFRLKARIASTNPDDFAEKSSLFPILRFAAPLGLAVVILGVLVFNGLYSYENQTVVPPLAENFSTKPDEAANLPVANSLSEQFVSAESNAPKPGFEDTNKKENQAYPKDLDLAANTAKSKNERRIVKNDGGGSKDSAYTKAQDFKLKDLNLNKSAANPNDFNNPKTSSIKDTLSPFGIEAVYSDNQWKVVSIKQNSAAERSGVKPNDIIEAIDKNRVPNETLPAKSSGGRNLNIVRDGKKMEIKLQDE